MRHFLLRLFQIVTALIIGTALWGGWYLAERGFTKKWRVYVTREIAKTGFDVSIKRLTLDPFRGLVAREVRIVDPQRGNQVLAVIDEIALDINFNNFVQKLPFIESLQLREAELSLPLGGADDGTLQIHRLNARVLLPPHQLYLSQAHAFIYGVEVAVSGRLINPEALRAHASKAVGGTASGQNWWRTVDDIMRQVSWKTTRAHLELTFNGDLAQPEQMAADLQFTTPRLDWRGCKWREIALIASYRRQTLDVKQCTARDALGLLGLTGTWNTDSGEAEGQVHCSLDVLRVLSAFSLGEALESVNFSGPPTVEINAHGNLKAITGQLWGRASLPAFSVKGARFEGISGGFSWDGTRWYAQDVVLWQTTGALKLNARQMPGDFRAQLAGSINPNALLPLVGGKAGELLREWNFAQPLQLQLLAHGAKAALDGCLVEGNVQLGATTFRGVPLKSATAQLRLENGVVTCNPLRVERVEGIGEGLLAYDFNRHEVRLSEMRTTLTPAEVAVWIDPRLVKNIAPYRFHGPPDLLINGTVQPDGEKKTALEILINAPRGLDYTFVKKTLSLPTAKARLFFTDGRLQITDLDGELFGGRLQGNADISLKPAQPGYRAHIEPHGVDFPSLTKLYFGYGNSEGKLEGVYDFTGVTSDPRTMSGAGSLKVTDGNVLAIPILGPLSGLLNGVLPGIGYNVARQATSSFTIKAGIVETHDFLVQGKGFDMLGSGTLDFLDDKIDFNLRINAQGFTGALLSPISRLFEYEGRGQLSKPTWHPKRLPIFPSKTP